MNLKFLINKIYNLPFSNRLPGFIRKKLLKNNNITFIPTKLKNLPTSNYPIQNSIKLQDDVIKFFNETKKLSFNTYPGLKSVLKKKFDPNSSFNFLDFGGEKMDFFLDISRNFKKINYFLINQPEINEIINNIKLKYNFKNLIVLNNLSEINKYHYDFVYFGSSIQYLNDYEKYLNVILPITKGYILISATHFFNNNTNLKKIVVKQLNYLPKVYYLYFFDLEHFIKLFSSFQFELEFKMLNTSYSSNLSTFEDLNLNNIKYTDIFFCKKN